MDMQFENIINVTEVGAITVTAGDMYNSNTMHTQNLDLNGNLNFGAGSMIYVNGIMVDPMMLAAGNTPPPSNYEERIQALESEKKELKKYLVRMQTKIENLEKWVQL